MVVYMYKSLLMSVCCSNAARGRRPASRCAPARVAAAARRGAGRPLSPLPHPAGPRGRARGRRRAGQVCATLQRRADSGQAGQVRAALSRAAALVPCPSTAAPAEVWRRDASLRAPRPCVLAAFQAHPACVLLRCPPRPLTNPTLSPLEPHPRVQLVSMCQLLSIPPYGTDSFLRNRLRSHLEKIKQVGGRQDCARASMRMCQRGVHARVR